MIQNNAVFDVWSIPHILVGILLGYFKVKPTISFSIILGTEIIENLILRNFASNLFKEQELILNIVSDIVLTSSAFIVVYYSRK